MEKMIKISLLAAAIMLVAVLGAGNFAQAQEAVDEAADVTLDETVDAADLGVAEPSGGLLGFFKSVANGVQYALTFNPVKKAELKLDHANEFLLKAQKALAEDPESVKAQERYQNYLEKFEQTMTQVQEKVQTIKEKAVENPKVDQFLNKLTDNSFKQQRIMDHFGGLLDEDQRAALQEKRENALKTVGEALKNLDDLGNLPARLENVIGQQEGSRLIHLKNLEVLQALENKLPEEALQGLKNAQENAISKLNDALQNMNAEDRKEKMQSYLQNSNSDPLAQLEALAGLESAAIPADIKSLIPQIKDDKIQQVDEMINAFKNDEHKIMNLERIRQIEDPETKTILRQIENKYVDPNVPANTPLKVDSLKAEVRNAYKERELPARQEGGLDKEKDLRDRVKDEPEQNTLLNAGKNIINNGVEFEAKPVRMQEKVEGGVDKVKDTIQNRVEAEHKIRQEAETDTAESAE